MAGLLLVATVTLTAAPYDPPRTEGRTGTRTAGAPTLAAYAPPPRPHLPGHLPAPFRSARLQAPGPPQPLDHASPPDDASRTGGSWRSATGTAEPPAPPEGQRAWPVGGPAGSIPVVVRGWEPPPSPWAAGHRGVDLAASAGTPIRAAAPGRVSFAGQVAGRGVLSIELLGTGHPPLRTTYEPVRATVHRGDRVAAGQVVAVLEAGPYHCAAGCLHWGLRRGRRYLNPLSLLPPAMLRGGPSRLLPVFGVPEPW